jgi:hypothetical protein
MNRLAATLLAGACLASSAGLALAAGQPMSAKPAAGRSAGDRMTAALNLLEAKGYGDFSNFKADGNNFAATVKQNGKSFGVVIEPDSGQITRQG